MSMLNDLEAGDDVNRPLLNKDRVRKIRKKNSRNKGETRRGGSHSESISTPEPVKERSYPMVTGGGEPVANNEPNGAVGGRLDQLGKILSWVGKRLLYYQAYFVA